jgi:hypothetical protein
MRGVGFMWEDFVEWVRDWWEGDDDLDPNDIDNYESNEGLRGGWDIENSEDFDD